MDSVKVRPRIWIGLAVAAGYLVVVFVVSALSGIAYDELGASASNLFRGAGVDLIVGAILLVVTITALGWWRPVLFDRERSRHRWPIFVPVLNLVLVVVNLVAVDWRAYTLPFLGASLAILLVGFTEEVVFRGVLLFSLRQRLNEVWVWLLTSLLFALSHLINIALGAETSGTIVQLFAAFAGGTVYYILRRTTGSLIYAMVLHGLWDFSVFATGVGEPNYLVTGLSVFFEVVLVVAAFVVLPFVIRGARERASSSAGVQAVP
jgi:membrane protease YdiL (CAAX protease family)